MRSSVDGDPRLLAWRRVREFAVPPSMIDTATARRLAGDWAGACAAARVDPDLDPFAVVRVHGRELAGTLRDDLRHLAPDLLRWHLPRVEDGRLRPGLTVSLVRYAPRLHLVARTAPAWADADQRISLALWAGGGDGLHPHPRPHRRFRFDLHHHLWDVRHATELRERAGVESWPGDTAEAAHRWAAEADILRRAQGRAGEPVLVRINARDHRELPGDGGPARDRRAGSAGERGNNRGLPRGSLVLPDAATWVPPDLELLRAGLIEPGRLHPLVAAALAPGPARAMEKGVLNKGVVDKGAITKGAAERGDGAGNGLRLVECRGRQHRIGLVDGVLAALDHNAGELRREEILTGFGGTPLPCLRVIGEATRAPETLTDIRARLDHGDLPGALRAVEALLGPYASLRDGPLRDELARAEQRHRIYELYRSGRAGHGPTKDVPLPRRRTKVTR
ncbi:hypothetical protein [Actinoplanes siamensis]|nr:hypothetical protein [Actinoplanes siamensis]